MIKKFLLMALLAVTTASFANQTVSIVWPFDPGSNQSNFIRVLAEEANKQQSKYTFVFDNKPGAGGSIAAKHVLAAPNLTLISSSSSFHVRPVFYPNESHRVEDFRLVMVQCTGQPYSIVSSKYKTLAEVKQQKTLSIGVGLGSLTEAVAREFESKFPGTKLTFVGYSGTIKPMIDLQSGVLDLSVALPGDIQQFVNEGKVSVIGSSGQYSYPKSPSFTGQGVKGFEELVGNYAIYAPASVSNEQAEELHGILSRAAAKAENLNKLYAADYCRAANLTFRETNSIFTRWVKYWPEKLQSLK